MRNKLYWNQYLGISILLIILSGCTPQIKLSNIDKNIPDKYQSEVKDASKTDTNVASLSWKEYFSDPNLIELVDIALTNNQELNLFLEEMRISKNQIGAKQGAYLPSVDIGVDAGLDKVGTFTRDGAIEENLEIAPDRNFPDPLSDFSVGLHASWEIDIWGKLRNAEKSALTKYLASVEGRNFMVTKLISEIANSYYELLALDNQLSIVKQNISIQTNAVKSMKLKQESARVTKLALRRFEAQMFKSNSLFYQIQQEIVEKENKINFLVGRYPQKVARNSASFNSLVIDPVSAGIPDDLLSRRPDIRQAELEVAAANLDVQVAKALFYPSLSLTGGFGYSAYRTSRLFRSPESMIYSFFGGLTAPFINRREIEAMYKDASALQVQAVIRYQQVLLKAFIEITNQLSNIQNLKKSYGLKSQQASAMTESSEISTILFDSARADYTEVLLTQREALEARLELAEIKQKQLHANVNIYRSLGGGWKD